MNIINSLIPSYDTAKKIGGGAAFSYGIAYLGRNAIQLNPAHAALFTAVSRISNFIAYKIFIEINNPAMKDVMRYPGRALGHLVAIGLPCAVLYAVGVKNPATLITYLGLN